MKHEMEDALVSMTLGSCSDATTCNNNTLYEVKPAMKSPMDPWDIFSMDITGCFLCLVKPYMMHKCIYC